MTEEERTMLQGILGLGGVPLILAMVQAFKPLFGDDKRWYPLISLLIGVGVNAAAVMALRGPGTMSLLVGALQGVMAGLSASGLYSTAATLKGGGGVSSPATPEAGSGGNGDLQAVIYGDETIGRYVKLTKGTGIGSLTVILRKADVAELLLVKEGQRLFLFTFATVSPDGTVNLADRANPQSQFSVTMAFLREVEAKFV